MSKNEIIAQDDEKPMCYITENRRKYCSDEDCVHYIKGDKKVLINQLLRNEQLLNQMVDFFVRQGMDFVAQIDGKNDLIDRYSKGLSELGTKWIDWLDGDKPFRYMELFKLCLYNLQEDVKYDKSISKS